MYLLANKCTIINDLTTNNANAALSAAQGDKIRRFYIFDAITFIATNMTGQRYIYFNHQVMQITSRVQLNAGTYRTTSRYDTGGSSYYYAPLGYITSVAVNLLYPGYNAESNDRPLYSSALFLGYVIKEVSGSNMEILSMYAVKQSANQWDIVIFASYYRGTSTTSTVTVSGNHYFTHIPLIMQAYITNYT